LPKRVAVIGSLNMDLVIKTARMPQVGETIKGSDFIVNPGGKGANQAVAAGRLAGDVYMIGCVGNDNHGQALINNLEKSGIKTDYIQKIDRVSTGVAVIIVNEDGNNSIILHGGANDCINGQILQQVEKLIIQSDYVLLQLEIPLATVEYIAELSKMHHKTVILNPAPATKLNEKLLKNIDIIVPNETECEILTGINADCNDNALKAAKLLYHQGVKQIVITMGKNGAFYYDQTESFYIPVIEVEAVDTTAAGDCLIGALVAELSRGKNIKQALEFAVAASNLAVTKRGAQSSLPTLKEVNEFIEKRK
jgi:ribokinase